ncbi:ABC transporter permease [Corynebacterium aquatimens]|uniref:Peptide/nickel transport system permease protein n=1 Tax=Corynebacterium aquatimens TaxID=1190508 RepID=A0A931GR29_9CORY|nr:ABC transporter permease [Corynebacterium aquatimens]MBG6121498.1 peptide/nickel transport system permease protein [Corynebacterium aquatimens]WJY65959.1 Glutathione transport system permease protein GsiD [Corynebacterium aquatimens]
MANNNTTTNSNTPASVKETQALNEAPPQAQAATTPDTANDTGDTALKTSHSKPKPLYQRVWAQPEGKVGAILTGIILLITVIGFLFAEQITGYSTTEFVGLPFVSQGLFGTDLLGRSVLSRFLAGGLILIVTAFLATLLGMVVGTIIGMIAGYVGGRTDAIIMRINDVFLAFPQLIFAMLAIVIFGESATVLVLVIGLTHAPRIARVARAATQSVTNEDYIRAAQMYSVPHWKILNREVMPNITGPLAVEAGLRLTYSIGSIASLSFLGMGIQPPTADWGLMINENRIALPIQPWGVVLPVIAIAILTIGTNMLADATARATATTAMPIKRTGPKAESNKQPKTEPIHNVSGSKDPETNKSGAPETIGRGAPETDQSGDPGTGGSTVVTRTVSTSGKSTDEEPEKETRG